MKRKCVDESLSSPSKSRRLDDYDLLQMTKEPRSLEAEVLQDQEQPHHKRNALSEERALVLYNPANTPFLTSPTSTHFTALLNSDLIPGLKDLIYRPGNPNRVTIEDRLAAGKIAEASNDSLAVVPWVQPQFPLVSATGASSTTSPSQPMEAEEAEAEMMDTDNSSNTSNARNASEFIEMAGAQGLQFWQQQHHFARTGFLQDKYNHVSQ